MWIGLIKDKKNVGIEWPNEPIKALGVHIFTYGAQLLRDLGVLSFVAKIKRISIYTLNDHGVLSSLIGSLSLAIKQKQNGWRKLLFRPWFWIRNPENTWRCCATKYTEFGLKVFKGLKIPTDFWRSSSFRTFPYQLILRQLAFWTFISSERKFWLKDEFVLQADFRSRLLICTVWKVDHFAGLWRGFI